MKPLYIILIVIAVLIVIGVIWKIQMNKAKITQPNQALINDPDHLIMMLAPGNRMAIVKNQSACNIQQLNQAFANFSVADAQQMNLYSYYCSNKSNSNYNNWQTAANQAQALASVYNVMYNNCYRAVNGADKNIGISFGPSC